MTLLLHSDRAPFFPTRRTVIAGSLLSAATTLQWLECHAAGHVRKYRSLCAFEEGTAATDVTVTGQQDSFLNNIAQDVEKVFQLKPPIKITDDSSHPTLGTVLDQQGVVLVMIGSRFLDGMKSSDKKVEELIGFLAHEFTHAMQYHLGCMNTGSKCNTSLKDEKYGTVKFFELQADFLAGWALARLNKLTTDSFQGFQEALFKGGNRFFANAQHHGTPRQRLSSMAAGYRFGKSGIFDDYVGINLLQSRGIEVERLKQQRSDVRAAFDAAQAYVVGVSKG